MHSVSDLTTTTRKTTGDVPRKLVGASTTVVDDKMYLFGGRLVTERTMVSDLYVLDLETFVWQKIEFHPDDDVPAGRYFHSSDAWNNMLVVFGGMGHKPTSVATDDLCVLNDVRFFDLSTRRWLSAPEENMSNGTSDAQIDPVLETVSDAFVPRARYAHLSSVTSNRLFIIGGQDLNNLWLDDVCVYELSTRKWVHRREYPRHSGTYRSVAVAGHLRVRFPAEETKTQKNPATPPGSRFKADKRPSSAKGSFTAEDSLIHLPYSAEPTDEFPNDIYLYSNYNFTDVKRELEVFTPLPDDQGFELTDRSSSMTGTTLPPGLRFPSGAICGTHLIFAGTYLAHSYQSYSIWALDLQTMTWTRLEPGSVLNSGSWFRSCLWSSTSGDKFLVFGNRNGNLVEDYNRRLLSWDDIAVIDLEVFGIYQPPSLQLEIRSQILGLAALEEGLLADFEVICDDGRRIPCSRQVLEKRWPWFREQRKLLLDEAQRALEKLPKSATDVASPQDPLAELRSDKDASELDPRLTPRTFLLSEPYPITNAFLQYFYTMSLITPLQHAPAVLSQLMLLSATYNLPHLQEIVKHAMHRALSPSVSVGVYEVATLCSCQSLQIRALKAVMSSSRRAGNRHRGNSSSAGGGPGSGGGGNEGGNHGAARPRGMSDLRAFTRPDGGAGMSGGGNSAEGGGAMGRQATNGNQVSPLTIPDRESVPPTSFSYPRQRPTHSVNLSMDSVYQALKNAEEDTLSLADDLTDSAYDDTESEVAPSPIRRDDFHKRPKRVASHSALSSLAGNSAMPPVSSRPSILRTTSHSSLFEAANVQGLRGTIRPSESKSSLAPSASSSSLGQGTSRLLIPGSGLASDSDTPSLSYSSRTSTVSSVTSSRSRPSPLTPDSPPLKTPITPSESFNQLFSAGIHSQTSNLSAIDESSIYEETLQNGSRDSTPNKFSSDLSTIDEKNTSWGNLPPSVSRSKSPIPTTPNSSNFSTFPAETIGSSKSSGSLAQSDSRHSELRSGFSAKSLFSSKSKKSKPSSDHNDRDSSVWHDSADMKKASKAEEKRQKKEEERRRLEQLAESLRSSAEKAKHKDNISMLSSGSSERRRAANQWLESSDGMYGGGGVGGWSSL